MIKFSKNRLLSRRKALKIGLSAIAILVVLSVSKLKALSYLIYTLTDRQEVKNNDRRTFRVVGKGSLKQRAKAKGLVYGAYPHINPQDLERNIKLKSTFGRECGLVVAGFFWGQNRPTATTFNFSSSDYFAKLAATNKMLLRGHPLVWHLDLPPWVNKTLNTQNARQIMTTHIQTVVKRYAGRMHSWDVVNEAIEINEIGRAHV